jgi:hypothetical protein
MTRFFPLAGVAALAAAATSAAPAAPAAAIGRAADVSRIAAVEAGKGRPVRLSGTVVYSDPAWGRLGVVDPSGAALVDPAGLADLPPPGALVEIEGRTGVMGGAPVAVSVRMREAGRGALPPASATLERIRPAPASWVALRGVVRAVRALRGHAGIDLQTGEHRVEAFVAEALPGGSGAAVDAAVVVTGLLEWSEAGLHGPRLWVPSWTAVAVRDPPRPASDLPVLPIGDVLGLARADPPVRRLRVRGRLVERHSDHDFTIEDATGRIRASGLSRTGLAQGVGVDVVGFLERGAGGPQLVDVAEDIVEVPDFLQLAEEVAADAPVLRRLADVRALSGEEARRSLRVDVTAVVTLFDPEEGLLFVQDETAAVYVLPTGAEASLAPGQRVRLTGWTAPGALAPIVAQPRLEPLPGGGLPPAAAVSASRLATGQDDCRLVAIEGRVRRILKRASRCTCPTSARCGSTGPRSTHPRRASSATSSGPSPTRRSPPGCSCAARCSCRARATASSSGTAREASRWTTGRACRSTPGIASRRWASRPGGGGRRGSRTRGSRSCATARTPSRSPSRSAGSWARTGRGSSSASPPP